MRLLAAAIAVSLFVLITGFPMILALLPAKAALFGVLALCASFSVLLSGRLRLDRRILWWGGASIGAGLVATLVGLYNRTPGARSEGLVYCLWPVIHLLLMQGVDTRMLRLLHRTALVVTVLICAFGVHFVLSTAGLVPQIAYPDWLMGENENAVSFFEGYVHSRFIGLNSLPFLLPYAVASFIAPPPGRLGAVDRWLAVGALVLGGASVLLASRRALTVVVALAVPVTLGFLLARRGPALGLAMRRVAVLAGIAFASLVATLAVVMSAAPLDVGSIGAYFSASFARSPADAIDVDAVRSRQLEALVRGIEQRPFVGTGAGGFAPEIVRDDHRPWAYELYYVALLFQVGVIVFAVYLGGMAWVVWTTRRLVAEGDPLWRFALPAMVGCICFLIATASNPYLARFDGEWVVFWPIAVLNCWFLRPAAERVQHLPEALEPAGLGIGT